MPSRTADVVPISGSSSPQDVSGPSHRPALLNATVPERVVWSDGRAMKMWWNIGLDTHKPVVVHRGFGLVKIEFLCHVTSAQFVGHGLNPRFVDLCFAEAWCCHVGQ